MSERLRSSSVGSRPKLRLQRPSRAESAQAVALDVRCGCQFYETKSLLPERVNPIGYNTVEEFGPCVHIQGSYKSSNVQVQQNGFKTSLPITSSTSVQSNTLPRPILTNRQHSNYELPPEFAPENLLSNSNVEIPTAFGNRSVSYTNMGAVRSPTSQLMKQRDPSSSSLLRKRMSEEHQTFPTLNKRMSQSSISQKDPSQSTILRRKMYNRSSASIDRASNVMVTNEHIQPLHPFQTSRIPNERTFYHDSNDLIRNSNMEINVPTIHVTTPREMISTTNEIASPLSMKSKGNRRFMLSSTENLPQTTNSYGKILVEIEQDSGIDSNFIEDSTQKMEIDKQLMERDQRPQNQNQNVCDEDKVLMLTKSQDVMDSNKLNSNQTPKPNPRIKSKLIKQTTNGDENAIQFKPIPTRQNLQLMKVEDVETIEMPTQSKLQIQYIAKFDSTLRPQEAQTNEYSYSKIFDNYKKSESPMTQSTNVSMTDLRNQASNYIRQRDPSRSTFLQNRYATINIPSPTPTPGQAVIQMPIEIDQKKNREKLLPAAGEYPERRASEINPPQLNQEMNQQFIRQKDMKQSNILNRRRRNLSQTSFGRDSGFCDLSQSIKITKTISFEKNLEHNDAFDQMSPNTGSNTRIAKGVSFEFDKPLPVDHIERLDFSYPSANNNSRRPFR